MEHTTNLLYIRYSSRWNLHTLSNILMRDRKDCIDDGNDNDDHDLPSVHLSIDPIIYQSTISYLPIYRFNLSIYYSYSSISVPWCNLSIHHINLSIYVYLSYLSIHPFFISIYPSVYLSIISSIHLSYLSIHLSYPSIVSISYL